ADCLARWRVCPDGERRWRPAWQAGKVTTPDHSTTNSGSSALGLQSFKTSRSGSTADIIS
ncbi:MAG TPA: hypothetical protein VIM11_03275, partial [Tepidisphaeraceae bacterium]